jgi:hypothetical protein
MQYKRLAQALGFSLTFLAGQAHAGLLDDLLKNPTIQGLMGRSDLNTLVAACRDPAYRQANPTQCTNMENALVLSRLPNEMRVLMSNAQSASSLREICAAVQGQPSANSYLCAELRKAELAVGTPSAPPPAAPSNDGLRG